jgi:outer membrane protein assembly factor BamB
MILVGLICVALVVGPPQTLAVQRADVPVVTYAPTANVTPFPTPSELPSGNDWTQYRFDLKGTGVNPEDLLTTANAPQLTQRWTVNSKAAYESTPAVVNGLIYIANGRVLYAYDLRSGKVLWHYDGAAKGRGAINSSVAVDPTTHMAYFGTPDAYVYAVDIRTGTGVWSEQIGDSTKGGLHLELATCCQWQGVYWLGLEQRSALCARGRLRLRHEDGQSGMGALHGASGQAWWRRLVVGDGGYPAGRDHRNQWQPLQYT